MNGKARWQMKYDFDLSLDEHTSVGKVVAQISPGSSVLEFGPGNGRITKYLTDEKNCQVSIVEFDEVLFQHVMSFAEDGFLGNIEEYLWVKHFQGKNFDYIIFADVLEHLVDSEKALAAVVPFLSENGKVLISFPNLAHNSVLIDLFNNELKWKEYGLLDKTHNSFYTEEGFHQWFKKIGLNIELEDYTYSQVGQNEFDASYDDVPLAVQYPLKNRPFGEVYQYFFVLTPNPVANIKKVRPQNSNFVKKLNFEYHYQDHIDQQPILLNNKTGENKQFTLHFSEELQKVVAQIEQNPCIVRVTISKNDQHFTEFTSNAVWSKNDIFVFREEHAEIYIPGEIVRGKKIDFSLDYIYVGQFDNVQKNILEDIIKQKAEISELYEVQQKKELNYQDTLEMISTRYDCVIQSNTYKKQQKWERFKEKLFTTNTKKNVRDELVKFQIESLDNDKDLNTVIVKGWGFSKKDKHPLTYSIREDEGPYYKVTSIYRPDVTDMFELKEKEKYGFLLEIKHHQIDKYLHLIFKTFNNEEIKVRVNRYNLSNTSALSRARYLLGMLRAKGIKGTYHWAKMKKLNKDQYQQWIETYEQFDVEAIEREMTEWSMKPKISIVVPVYNVEEKWLRVFIDSLKKQFYPNWELCIADDCSTEPYIKPLLKEISDSDARIKVVFREENGHISEATNSAIGLATGEFIGFMDNDDELAPNALYEVVKTLNADSTVDFFYTDEDKIDIRGNRFDPFFKPNWNSELLLGHNYITHFVVVRKDLITKVGGLRKEFNGSQDYDFVLRATEVAENIYHIPKILYHWRTVETSVAFDPQSKEYAYVAGKRAIEEALKRRNILASVEMTKNYGCYKIDYHFGEHPKVSIIIHGQNDKKIDTTKKILDMTRYPNYEIVLSKMDEPITFGNEQLVLGDSENLNELAAVSNGDYYLFIQAGYVPKNGKWLSEMVNYGHRDLVGAVGGKVVNKEDIVYNAGVLFEEKEKALVYDQRGISNKSLGYYFRITLPRMAYAVTEDFLFVSSHHFKAVNGFDETLAKGLKGVELCLKLANRLNLKNIWQPYSILIDTSEEDVAVSQKEIEHFMELTSLDERTDEYKNPNRLG